MDHNHPVIKHLNTIQGERPSNDKLYARGKVIDEFEKLEKQIKKLRQQGGLDGKKRNT